MNNRGILALSWIVLTVGLIGTLVFFAGDELSFKTDVLELFPSSSNPRVLQVATELMEGETSRKVLFVLSSESAKKRSTELDDVAESFASDLRASSLFETVVSPGDRRTRRAYFDFYFPHRYQLLSPSVEKAISTESPVRSLVSGVRRYLYGSTAPFVSDLIPRDPLLLFPRLMNYWQSELGGRFGGSSRDNTRIVVAQLNGDPYTVSIQERFENFYRTVRDRYENRGVDGVSIRWSGVVRFAKTIRERMRQDLRTIGILSVIAVVLLILFAFRSFRYLLVLVATLAASVLSALAVLFLIWPDPHIFTIVFSTSLIGVSVDYAFHFFAEEVYSESSPRKSMETVLPGLTIGMITTLIGYLGLTLTPLPLLKQMAVFSSTGIVVAFGTVVLLYPYVFRSGQRPGSIAGFDYLGRTLLAGWNWIFSSPVRTATVGLLILLLLAGGMSQLSFTDDVRYFQNVSDSLVQRDRKIRKRTGQWNTGRFIMVEAGSPQALLEKLESLEPTLSGLVDEGIIGNYRSLVPFLPSKQRQRESFGALETTLLAEPGNLRSELRSIGISQGSIRKLLTRLRTGPKTFITPGDWVSSRVSFGLRSLWLGETDRGYSSLVLLRNISSESKIREALSSGKGVYYRNRLEAFNKLFSSYRLEAMVVTGLAYLVILVLLMGRYGIVGGLLAASPSILGGLLTVSILSLWGWSFNVTHVLALLLILGIGIDYAVFLREGLLEGRAIRATMVAIVLSALSTICSFGFLGLSRARMLNSIGVTVFVGILVVLLLAPVVQLDLETRD